MLRGIIKASVFCVLTLAFLLNISFNAYPEAAGASVDEACKGVVRIVSVLEDNGSEPYASGSGFGVGKAGEETEYFVTNRHVVSDDDDRLLENIYILLDNDAIRIDDEMNFIMDKRHMVLCDIVYASSEYPDIAVLRAKGRVEGRIALPLQRSEEIKRSSEVYALGFPGSGDIINGYQYFASTTDDVITTNGTVSRLTTLALAGDTRIIQHNAQLNHGNSGGPLVTSEGNVVGINTYLVGENDANDEYKISIYSDYAIEALEECGIEFDLVSNINIGNEEVDGADNESSAGNTVWDSGSEAHIQVTEKEENGGSAGKEDGAVGEDLEKSGTDKDRDKDESENNDVDKDKGIFSYLWIVLPALVLLFLFLLGLILWKSRRASRLSGGDAPGSFRLVGLNGVYEGKVFPMDDAIRIGRDPNRNNIVYPRDYPGISGEHCVLYFRGKGLYLKDCGSSYGTFINGEKLEKWGEVRLRKGDRFYLANPLERFQVT